MAGSHQAPEGSVIAVLSRIDADGTHAWSRDFSEDPQASYEYFDVDATAGVVVAVGQFGAICGISAWDPEGEPLWHSSYESGDDQAEFRASSVLFLDDDRVIVACQQTEPVSDNPLHLLEYDVFGLLVDERRIDDPVPGPSNVVIAPRLARSVDGGRFAFGAAALAPTAFNAWLSVYSSAGEPLWDFVADGPAALDVDDYSQVSFSPTGGVFAVGTFHSDTSSDAWLHAFDARGEQLWERVIGDPASEDDGEGLAVAADGSVFVHGDSRVDENGDFDHWLRKYDSRGSEVWSQSWTDPDAAFSWDYASELALDQQGFVVALGTAYTPDVDQDVIVRKLAP